jgi:hypothetical protein
MRTKAIVVDISLPAACSAKAAKAAARGTGSAGTAAWRARQRAAERRATRVQVAHLRAVGGRA